MLPKEMSFIPFLLFFIAKDRENFKRGRKCCLSFAMKRDKKGIKAIFFGSLLKGVVKAIWTFLNSASKINGEQ
jgi:hypothetical protein